MKPDPVPQAGAIAIREVDGRPEVLLVRSSNGLHRIFPKGHIDPGETAEEAALRELEEEAGVSGRVVGPAGQLGYERRGRRYDVAYFLIAGDGSGPGEAGRDPEWMALERAIETLSFEEMRGLLRGLAPRIGAALGTGAPPR